MFGPRKSAPTPPPPGDDWFSNLFGFAESADVRRWLRVDDDANGGKTLKSLVNSRSYGVGSFSTPSLSELRERGRQVAQDGQGRLSVTNVVGDVSRFHALEENRHATFQVASQFNCLEFVEPEVTPEDGVTGYVHDKTQGPACSIACGAATVYRNYYASVQDYRLAPEGRQPLGQASDRQIDNLVDFCEVVGNSDPYGALFEVVGGYTLASERQLECLGQALDRLTQEGRLDEAIAAIRVGVQSDVEVTSSNWGTELASDRNQRVTQVFGSACAVSYNEDTDPEAWERFGRLVLKASFEATLWVALLARNRNDGQGGSNRVFLTCLGGGAFGNDMTWIDDAMQDAFELFQNYALDVRIVTYAGEVPNDLRALERTPDNLMEHDRAEGRIAAEIHDSHLITYDRDGGFLEEPLLVSGSRGASSHDRANLEFYEGVRKTNSGLRRWQEILPGWAVEAFTRDRALDLHRLGEVGHCSECPVYNADCDSCWDIGDQGPHEPLPLQCAAGPGLYWAKTGACFTWIAVLLLPWPVLIISECFQGDQGVWVGYARYPAAVVWASLFPLLLTFLAFEWKVLRHTIVPQVQVIGMPKILYWTFPFGHDQVKFSFWLAFTACTSLVGHMDLITNGLFLAITIKTFSAECGSGEIFNEVWGVTMGQGLLSWLPGHRSFNHLVEISWVLMFLQLVHATISAIPLRALYARIRHYPRLERRFLASAERYGWTDYEEQAVSYGPCTPEYCEAFAYHGEGGDTMYQTFSDNVKESHHDHGTCLYAFAEANRMVTVTSTRGEYAKRKVACYVQQGHAGPAFGLMKQQLEKAVHRLLLAGALESGLQVNIQCSLFALNSYISGKINKQILFSIVVGLLVAMKNILDGFLQLRWAYEELKKPEMHQALQRVSGSIMENSLRAKLRFLGFCLFLYFGLVSYAALKFSMSFHCEDRMFDLTGCVDLSSIERSNPRLF